MRGIRFSRHPRFYIGDIVCTVLGDVAMILYRDRRTGNYYITDFAAFGMYFAESDLTLVSSRVGAHRTRARKRELFRQALTELSQRRSVPRNYS